MEEFIINPENYQKEYIQNLNKCFNGWGGEKEYNWGFNRTVGEHPSDIMLIKNEEDGVIAGSGISYRKISGMDQNEGIDIGIMTGSWTLPAARRKGCFSKMINCSKEICKKNNVPFLTAFVTESNASYRRLESAGSFLLPTYHLFSPEVPFKNVEGENISMIEDNPDSLAAIYETFERTQSKFLKFQYTREEFFSQYIHRIKETTILKINNDFAVVEDGVDEIKILLLTYTDPATFKTNIQVLSNWCLKNRSKKAFFFTTRKELYEVCSNLGFENVPGYFTILSTSTEKVPYEEIFKSLNINMADKM